MAERQDDHSDIELQQLLMPSAEEQRAIICSLQSGTAEESLHVYTVSQAWYDRWKAYVGLELTATEQCSEDESGQARDITTSIKSTTDDSVADATSTSPPPGPIEMDLTEEDNISVDEKIWTQWVAWYGVAASHELDRRRWTTEERDFEICVLSPYCGLVENAVKTFDISEETGYAELQLRRVFRVPDHRATRLWICEKSRHSRFLPLLDRLQELCSQDCVDANKNYILAIEVANLDGTWPTMVPGDPVGSFDRYRSLVGRRHAAEAAFWETELGSTLDTLFGGITAELKETANGIVSTAKCMTSDRDSELSAVTQSLVEQTRLLEERRATVDRQSAELTATMDQMAVDLGRLQGDRLAFNAERQAFAEELVRMNTINKLHDSRVKLCVGGQIFMTSTLTLTKDSDSMLSAMFSGRHSLRQDDDGAYFIDRDGTHFRHILNYLRDGGFRPGTLPADPCFLGELCTEAEYYQLAGLTRLLTEQIRVLNEASTTVDGADLDASGSSSTTPTGGALTTTGPSTSRVVGAPSAGRRLQRKVSVQQATK